MTFRNPSPRILELFHESFGCEPDFFVRAPGRVDLIGAHVDYNDGWVLPAAITRDAWLAVAPQPGGLVSIVAPDVGDRVNFHMDDLDAKVADGSPLPNWALYPAGVAWALRGASLATPGMWAVLKSNVPIGGGASSSAAVEVAFALAWQGLGGWRIDKMQLAQLCLKAENEYVGVACGLMDQFASLFGRDGHALLLDCRTLDWEALPLPDEVAIVVADTTVRRQLTDGGLNTRRDECQAALHILGRHLPGIGALRDVSRADLDRLGHHLPETLRKRAQHVVDECARVLEAAEALRRGDVGTLGALANESQMSSRDLYESSGPALDAMWQAGRDHPACYGGRFNGAGFGGCVVFAVQADGADDFARHAAAAYQAEMNIKPEVYVTRAGDGAGIVAP